jgi:serine/threonine-protein kinase RsbW
MGYPFGVLVVPCACARIHHDLKLNDRRTAVNDAAPLHQMAVFRVTPRKTKLLSTLHGESNMTKKSSSIHEKNDAPSSTHFEVMLAAEVGTISPVVAWVMHLVSEMEYTAGKEFEIEMALREALANAVLHGCNADPSKRIECSVTCEEHRGILIVVSDPGKGFDPAKVPSPTNEQNIFSDHGRGIYLINTLMDEVRYERNGAEIHMRKY